MYSTCRFKLFTVRDKLANKIKKMHTCTDIVAIVINYIAHDI